MKKNQGILVLILTAVLIGLLAFTSAVGFGKTGTGSAKNIKTGLDLSGGVSITYQAVGDDISQEDMADTVYKLQQRVDSYSEESQVFQEGTDRITVEIPGVSDANRFWKNWDSPVPGRFRMKRVMWCWRVPMWRLPRAALSRIRPQGPRNMWWS